LLGFSLKFRSWVDRGLLIDSNCSALCPLKKKLGLFNLIFLTIYIFVFCSKFVSKTIYPFDESQDFYLDFLLLLVFLIYLYFDFWTLKSVTTLYIMLKNPLLSFDFNYLRSSSFRHSSATTLIGDSWCHLILVDFLVLYKDLSWRTVLK